MSGTLGSIARKAAPIALINAMDSPNDLATQGASTILQIGQQRTLRTATRGALERSAAPELAGIAGRAATAIGGRLAGRAAVMAIPVVGEAAGAAMLAYGIASFGYQAATGKSFDDTRIGRAVTRAENGTFHMLANAAGGVMDGLGLRTAARMTRGPLSELLTGTASDAPTAEAAVRAPPMVRPAEGTSIVMKPGPARAVSDNDWKESPFRLDPSTMKQTVQTTPMGRAFATMNMLTDDSGLDRVERMDFSRGTRAVATMASKARTNGLD